MAKKKLGTKRYHKNTSRFSSFMNSFYGIKYAFIEETNFIPMFIISFIVLFMSFYFQITRGEFIIIIICIFSVFIVELINTSIEVLVDLVSPEENPLAKISKDIAGGATLCASFMSLIIGLIIFLPKIMEVIK